MRQKMVSLCCFCGAGISTENKSVALHFPFIKEIQEELEIADNTVVFQ